MFSSPTQFRTRAYHAPEKGDAPAATPETALLVFWSFHSDDERAGKGFVYENETGGSYSYSKPVTPHIDWREALDILSALETEADAKLQPVRERSDAAFMRLRRNDLYVRALPYTEHPLLKLEQQQSSLHTQAEEMPKLARRAKPPQNGGP